MCVFDVAICVINIFMNLFPFLWRLGGKKNPSNSTVRTEPPYRSVYSSPLAFNEITKLYLFRLRLYSISGVQWQTGVFRSPRSRIWRRALRSSVAGWPLVRLLSAPWFTLNVKTLPSSPLLTAPVPFTSPQLSAAIPCSSWGLPTRCNPATGCCSLVTWPTRPHSSSKRVASSNSSKKRRKPPPPGWRIGVFLSGPGNFTED